MLTEALFKYCLIVKLCKSLLLFAPFQCHTALMCPLIRVRPPFFHDCQQNLLVCKTIIADCCFV